MSILHARWILFMKASIWRALMAVGMKFHHFAEPKPPRPNFKIVIPSRLSRRGGTFKLVFYVPESYSTSPAEYRFPCVVNFHGGGFTLGTGTDDARWASTVIHDVDAVLVSVEYRLAPEYPFSVGVEDGTDALIYLAAHAEELHLDPHRMALSGFSAGGNFAFTVPLMLHDLKQDAGKRSLADGLYKGTPAASNSNLLELPRPTFVRSKSSTNSVLKLSDLEPTELEIDHKVPDLTLLSIVSFYPPTDFRISRADKRTTNPQPEKNLPPMLTNLFDESYIHPADMIDLTDPYLSPAAASDEFLRDSYPKDIVLYTCEYDMLNAEGVAFGERLAGPTIGKTVHGGLILGVPHAFDKKPNPIKFPKSADKCYSEACAELRRVFGGKSSVEDRRQLDQEEKVERFEDEDVLGEANGAQGVNGGADVRKGETSELVSKKGRELLSKTPLASGRKNNDVGRGVENTPELLINGTMKEKNEARDNSSLGRKIMSNDDRTEEKTPEVPHTLREME